MDIHSVRQMLRTKSIYEIPLRVTYYARVSSETDEQLNSLGNQIAYYEEFIRKNPAWTYVPGYVDEGLSGISTRKRENFNRMIAESEEDRFDLVITKEISRFARNTLDSIQFTRQLLQNGVGVFFQNDNINTFDDDSELRLSIMSSIAQDELRKLSSRVKFGHQQAIKNNVVLGNGSMIGYRKENKRLIIDEEQAPIVRELFTLYATGSYSMRQIEDIFWQKGYRNSKGRRITHSTMTNMIQNPKYKGYYVGNKVRIVDMFTKKQHFLPPEEWVMFKDETGDIVPALVSEELWEQANVIMRRRSEDVKHRRNSCQRTNLFTGKLFCTHCGTAFYMRSSTDKQGEKHNKWVCSSKIEHGAESCPTFPIHEKELVPILFDVFRDTGDVSDAMVDEYEQMYRSLNCDGEVGKQIARQEGLLELARKKKNKLLELVALDSITPADFKTMTAGCNAEMAKAEQALTELHQQEQSSGEFKDHMATLRKTLQEAQRDVTKGTITREFVDTFIDKIFVTSEDKDRVRLDIRIFTGEATQKYLNSLKARASREGRPGHTFKKVVLKLELHKQKYRLSVTSSLWSNISSVAPNGGFPLKLKYTLPGTFAFKQWI